ncbi:M24 family metallopeptidase [Halorussus lipolyticus]|uniref:M24 family metallopeptidase n=1 Tax=Halorussus lipolyticus TaxID=3034024 RepID=UPI0023E7E49A|nr:Xaa-Pro peptidase family protein [Halorussus sp. DT80]
MNAPDSPDSPDPSNLPDPPNPPTTDYDRLADALAANDADAFVHVGDRFDDLLRYLTRFGGPDRAYAFVYADGDAHLCAPSLFAEQAEREFPGESVHAASEQVSSDAAERALEVLGGREDGPDVSTDDCRVVVPPTVSTATKETLAGGVGELRTEAVDVGRARKADAERACHAFVQRAAQRGMARAEAVLSAAELDSDEVRWRGDLLTTERLRRAVNATLSRWGVTDAGNSVIGAGPTCADLHFTGEDVIRPGETVLLDLSPRGPHGYYADLTRTFVLGEADEWATTAYEAVLEAQDAALAVLEGGAGTRGEAAHDAATDVLAEYGFDAGDVDVGMYHGLGHGVGVSLHEGPSLAGDEVLEAGNVVTVEPGVYDPEVGGVRIEDLVVITGEGYRNLTDYPREMVPGRWRE